MLPTHKVKPLPDEEQKAALPETMERSNEDCNFAAAAAFRIKSANKMRLQKEVKCVRCGFAGPADHVAAMNIAAGGRVNGPIVTGDLSSHVGLPQLQAHGFIRG